jgi:hypothetical protein
MNISNEHSNSANNLQIDNDKLWSKIENRLEKKRRRRVIVFFLIVTSSLMTTFYFLHNLNYQDTTIVNLDPQKATQPMENQLKISPQIAIAKDKNSLFTKEQDFDNSQSLKLKYDTTNLFKNNYETSLEDINSEGQLGFNIKVDEFPSGMNKGEFMPNMIKLEKGFEVMNALALLDMIPVKLTHESLQEQIKLAYIKPHLPIVNQSKDCIMLSTGYGIVNRDNSYNSNELKQFLTNKNQLPILSLKSQLRWTKLYSSNISAFFGLSFTQTYYSFNVIEKKTIEQLISSDTARHIEIDGMKYFFAGTQLKKLTLTKHFDVYNRFFSFEIPFGMGYTFDYKKSDFTINTSASYRIISKTSGYGFDNEAKVAQLSTLKDQLEFQKGFTSLSVEFRYAFNFNKNWRLSAGAEKLVNLKSDYTIMSKEGPKMYIRNNVAYLNLGLLYTIN